MLMALIILLSIAIILWVMIPVRNKRLDVRHKERLAFINQLSPSVESAFSEICSYYVYSHYITESEREYLLDKYSNLLKDVENTLKWEEMAESPKKEEFCRFKDSMYDTIAHKNANNEHFIQDELSRCSAYFDTVLSHPLDAQQRDAIVSLEDNVLVISSAGSGKTMTTVGKVRYLIDVQKVAPEKILLITFTRKAAESLSERLGEGKLKCRTFHRLALDIIAEATGEQPDIIEKDFPAQVYHKLFSENESFHRAVADYIINSRYKMKDQFEYDSREEYMKDRKKYGVQAYFKDMDGRPVFCKSDQESKICDFLGARGIKFRYEEKYEFNTADENYRQYSPDFSIYIDLPDGTTKRIYLEHLAVDEYGNCPSFFSGDDSFKYKQGIQWKRQIHASNGTILLETTSAAFKRGDVFDTLSKQLIALGAVFNFSPNRDLSRDLARQEELILNMLTAFNHLRKSRGIRLDELRDNVTAPQDQFLLDEIVLPFVKEYNRMEDDGNVIDFTDAIIRATDYCNNGYKPDYDYILVDEFQDISLDRYRFLQSLRKEKPLTKLFCVGDDWQSIYRFTGSDMALFKHFEDFFGYTKKCKMETTYRFGEPAVRQSSEFILVNPEQEVKTVHPFRSELETKLDFIGTDGRVDMVNMIKSIADQIPPDKEILMLGRYTFDVRIFKDSDLKVSERNNRVLVTYEERTMPFMTVHQSKGLEADYIILINCNGGPMGFPADIADSPVLKYVLSEPDQYAFSEERRVFYVSITRAKKQTWVLYDNNNPSPFIREFKGVLPPDAKIDEVIPEECLCPKCQCGRIVEVKRGKARNGNPYAVLACSNRKYGCDYQETVFTNLNHYKHF